MTEVLNSVIELTFFIITIRILIIIATAALITWVVKKVWNAGNKNAPKVHKPKPHNQWTDNWAKNASARPNNRNKYTDPVWPKSEKKWSPTGWYWDEKKGLWIPPDYLNSKQNTKVSEPLTPEERELSKQIHINRSQPTFEEWKATQAKKSPDGAYRYNYIHIPDSETRIEIKIPKTNNPTCKENKAPDNQSKPEIITELEYANTYEAKPILTKNEMRNFRTLDEAAKRKGYTVNLKPRLADIATPRDKDKQYMANFRRISQQHVDFAILDKNLKVIAVVELDDSSHDTEKGKKKDAFKDSVLKDCGYKVIHTRYIWPDILDNV